MRIAIYGDIDLNLVDGSAVWLASLVETLATGPDRIRLFLKAARRRDLLLGPLDRLPSVSMVEVTGGVEPARPSQALDAIEREDRDEQFGAVILRGFRVALEAARRPALQGRLWVYLTDIPQTPETLDQATRDALREVAGASRFMLCQTEELRSFLESHVPEACRRSAVLPPMIPGAIGPRVERRAGEPLRMIYAGKFAPSWATVEMVDVFRAVRLDHPDFELHVYGDKIHRSPDDPAFERTMESALTGTDGLTWHGAVPRETLLATIPTMDVAWGWRRPELSESLELSTKLLEYGAAGVPAILNRNQLHEQLLGSDYALFATDPVEAEALLRRLHADRSLLDVAAAGLRDRARDHTFEAAYHQRLEPLLGRSRRVAPRSRVILVAGHDLKFAGGVMGELTQRGHEVLVDQWKNHSVNDPDQSESLLARADVVLAEWCLGNAVWYSERMPPDKRLVVRFHAQELRTEYPASLEVDAIHAIVFVGEHVRDEARSTFGLPADKLVVIPNALDPVDLDRPKLPNASFNLGMLGYSPMAKGLARALDLLERVRAVDDRFVLFLKGRLPWEYPWLWERPEERAYFEAAFRRIRESPLLRDAVVFDPDGPDVAAWLRKIGTVLSVSDNESFHLAVAEAAASGARPVIVDWPGARSIYPADWIVRDLSAASERILASPPADGVKEQVRSMWLPTVTDRIEELLLC